MTTMRQHRPFRWTRAKYYHAQRLARVCERWLYDFQPPPLIVIELQDLWAQHPQSSDPLLSQPLRARLCAHKNPDDSIPFSTMPIRPENRARYPKDWPAISASIRDRAGNRCEWIEDGCRCQAAQYAVGHWARFGSGPRLWRPLEANHPIVTEQDRDFERAGEGLHRGAPHWTHAAARAFVDRWCWPDGERPTIIVLTVAHLNHEPEDCRPENLAAWCQRHHLAYDHEHHRANAWATRRARSGTLELF